MSLASTASWYAGTFGGITHRVKMGLEIERQDQQSYDPIVILYANVPVRPGDLIDRALDKFEQSGCDSVQSVCPVGKTHPLWARTLSGPQGDVLGAYQDNTVDRRQDLPAVYALDGGIIVVRRDKLLGAGGESGGDPHAFLGVDRRAILTERGQVVDVDDAYDLIVAEALLVHAKRFPA